jgi:hypothetical protein
LEQAIMAALHTAFARQSSLSTSTLLEEIAETRPLSRTIPERISGCVSGRSIGRTRRTNGVIPSRQARNPHRPDRELSVGTMKILRFAQDDDAIRISDLLH